MLIHSYPLCLQFKKVDSSSPKKVILITIGIDIDGVVNDLSLFHITCGTKYCFDHNILYTVNNKYIDSTDIFQWDVRTDQLFWEQYYLDLLLHSKFVRPFAAEVTKRLIDEGHSIIFITARKDEDLPFVEVRSMLNITSQYLKENHISYTELILSQSKDKIIISKNIDIMIEDDPLFFQNSSSLFNIPLFCFDTLYNTKISGSNIIRVYSWYDILRKIQLIRKGLV